MKKLTAMTDRVFTSQVVSTLRAAASDPMWDGHAEVRKSTLINAANLIDALIAGLIAAHKESNSANAQLTSLTMGDAQYAVRDAKLCAHHLERQQVAIREALIKAGG